MSQTSHAITLAFQTYIDALRKTPLDQKTEHSDRGALEILLNALSPAKVHVQHEPIRQGTKGSPDFKVTTKGAILGYVEVKTIGENLDAILKSPQIKKYLTLSPNILITDYLHFIWLKDNIPHRDTLAYPTDLASSKFKIHPDRAANIAAVVNGFFSQAPIGIARAQELALALATRSHLLRDGLTTELIRQQNEHQQGKLYGLLGAFRTQVFHELSLTEFADAFAQMLAYGLFLARLNTDQIITLNNARQFIPSAFPLIRELVDFLTELGNPDYDEIRWVVEEILSILNGLNLADIRRDLSFSNRKSSMRKVRAGSEEEHRLFERDPFVYFYEDFLAKYDAKLKKSRGVYYTPPPVVNFIIRAIDDILKSEFSIADGLADHKRVTMLDFATGTGTFILEAMEKMFETIGDSPAKRDLLVRDHILKNIIGFEYLIAPYTIAHLKLSQYLLDKGHKLSGHERFQVYLTNTLEPIAPQSNFLLPALSAEADSAQEIKKKPILVITGNPPYSGESKNKGTWISAQINAYRRVDGQPLGERNPKWLNDDYVKFIRFAQDKIDQVPEGIIGIITNHSFLDNPTFRGMRQSLMTSFDKIYVLDLHGNAKKKEKSPDGTKDENVFDIEQGVSISLFVKTNKPKLRQIWRADLWGSRLGKYESCARLSIGQPLTPTASSRAQLGNPSLSSGVDWREITPSTPFYLFETGNAVLEKEYRLGASVTEIFPVNSVGVVTARDNLAIQFDKQTILKTIRDFVSRSVEEARTYYKLGADVRDWRIEWAQKDVKESGLDEHLAVPLLYRPFDERWTYYTGHSRGFLCYPREEVMRQMKQENVALLTSRLTKGETFKHVQVTDKIVEVICMSPTTSNNGFVFPLYLYPPNPDKEPKKADLFGDVHPFTNQTRIENISAPFRADLNARYGAIPTLTPEQIFGYVYAILHAPTYRTRYAEFLRGDFPRIPLAPTREAFEALASLGWDLAQKHLLKSIPPKLGKYRGAGENTVEKPRYSEIEQAVYINQTQSFAPVPEPVWNFHIGGYQVIEKYLKSRKGRKLTLDEVITVENIITVLNFTIAQMAAIDSAYKSAFPT